MLTRLLTRLKATTPNTDLEPTHHYQAFSDALEVDNETPELTSDQVLSVAGVKLAIGLTWTEVESSKEARRFTGKGGAYLTLDVSGQKHVAKGPASTIGMFAGGALVSKVIDNALVFHKIEEGKYWVCLIKDGIPQPTFDRIINSSEEAHQAYSSASEHIAIEGVVVGDIFNASRSLHEVIREATELDKREIRECRLKKNGVDVTRLLAATALIAVMAACSKFIIAQRESLRDEERRLAALKSLVQSQQEKEAQERRITKLKEDYLARFSAEQRNFGQQAVAFAQWNLCESIRKSLPITASGYRPEKLTCDFQAHKSTVEWRAVNTLTRLADRARLPGIINPLDTEGPILSDFPLDSDKIKGSQSQKIDLQVVKMVVLDWSSRHIKSMKFGQAEAVVMRPPAEIKGMPGVHELTLGKKVALQINTSNSSEMLSLPWGVEILNQYPVNFESIVWSRPTGMGAQVSASSTLYIPQ